MAGSDVFIAGTTGANLLRGIYDPGSQGNQSAWASSLGLSASKTRGLISTRVPDETISPPQLSNAASSVHVIRDVLAQAPLPRELLGETPEILFGSRSRRPRRGDVVPRVWSVQTPDNAFLPLDEHLYLCSPAFLFVQRATKLGLIGTISYGNELCGMFSIDQSDRGINDHRAFGTPNQLSSAVASCPSGKGAKTARVALKWIAAGFRSPKESDTYLLTCLPRAYGGYGIYPRPAVNAHVDVPPELFYLTQVRSYEVDLLWLDSMAVVEYDGSDHATSEQRLRDDIKTHVLEEMGYLVIRINWDILSNPREFDKRMRLLASRLNEQIPLTTSDFARKREDLRRMLFEPNLH